MNKNGLILKIEDFSKENLYLLCNKKHDWYDIISFLKSDDTIYTLEKSTFSYSLSQVSIDGGLIGSTLKKVTSKVIPLILSKDSTNKLVAIELIVNSQDVTLKNLPKQELEIYNMLEKY